MSVPDYWIDYVEERSTFFSTGGTFRSSICLKEENSGEKHMRLSCSDNGSASGKRKRGERVTPNRRRRLLLRVFRLVSVFSKKLLREKKRSHRKPSVWKSSACLTNNAQTSTRKR